MPDVEGQGGCRYRFDGRHWTRDRSRACSSGCGSHDQRLRRGGGVEKLCGESAVARGVRVAPFGGADLSKPADATGLIEHATREFGRVAVLVNNAGIQHVAPVHAFPLDRWDAVIAINLTAVFLTPRAALLQLLARDWGRIINIASVDGLVVSIDKSAHVASRHGVAGFTKGVALETATTGITCNAICPGWVLTPLVQKQIDALAAREKLDLEQARVCSARNSLRLSLPTRRNLER